MDFRSAVLRIDRSTVLPLMYEYDATDHRYRTMGYVRAGSMMVTQVEHAADDEPRSRDDFLVKVLMSLSIPERRARTIVREAQHSGGEESTEGEPYRPGEQTFRNEWWELSRLAGEDFWQLTNISRRPLHPANVVFLAGARRHDTVLLGVTVPVLAPDHSTRMHAVASDAVTRAIVHWRKSTQPFSRTREWTVDL